MYGGGACTCAEEGQGSLYPGPAERWTAGVRHRSCGTPCQSVTRGTWPSSLSSLSCACGHAAMWLAVLVVYCCHQAQRQCRSLWHR